MLVDTFMFYNELDVLELRLTVLDEYVDRFVLVESELNHAGGTKELFFTVNRDRFAKWLHKIEHVVVTAAESPRDSNPWSREKYQRSCILRGLVDVPDSAIVMVSDVDEIPNLEVIPWERLDHAISSVHMWMFYYSFDFILTTEPWFGTVITTCELFKKYGPNHFRDNRWNFAKYHSAGWHLSSFGDGKHVANKLNTFAHSNDPHEIEWSPDVIQNLIKNGIWADGRTRLLPRGPEVPLPGSIEVLRRLQLGTFP
jgi:beta-1,4-mannosyl-glycoprotein beta-1,4-N-acetylglucosaminyltransferase